MQFILLDVGHMFDMAQYTKLHLEIKIINNFILNIVKLVKQVLMFHNQFENVHQVL